jgi:hypothetical protein
MHLTKSTQTFAHEMGSLTMTSMEKAFRPTDGTYDWEAQHYAFHNEGKYIRMLEDLVKAKIEKAKKKNVAVVRFPTFFEWPWTWLKRKWVFRGCTSGLGTLAHAQAAMYSQQPSMVQRLEWEYACEITIQNDTFMIRLLPL